MKVRCEYCQNIVEAAGHELCPFCGSPLPKPPEPEAPRAQTGAAAPAKKSVSPLVPLLLLAVLIGVPLVLLRAVPPKDPAEESPSVTEVLEALNAGTAEASWYQTAITYYLEGGKVDTAYQAARELLERPDGGDYMAACVQSFLTFDQPGLAARLAMASDAGTGTRTLRPLVEGLPISQILDGSPLCQAMELVLGRTASKITLSDLQQVTGLSVGRRDTRTGAQEIGVAFDPAGEEPIYVTVEFTGQAAGLGTVCFQGLRRFLLNDTNIRTREDLYLPRLRELRILLTMDAEDLTRFTHLTELEVLQLGGSSLTSLEGLDAFPALRGLCLFGTGLTDLSVLAARPGLERLSLLDNGQLTSVASLSQAGQLRALELSGKSLTDLSPLSSLSGLEELHVTGTAIRDAAFLSGMTGLRTLELTGNGELGALPELAGLSGLERLTLDSDEQLTADALAGLTSLRALKLRISKSLRFLSPLQDLEELTIYTYQSTWDLSPLAQLHGLKRLRLRSGNDFYDSYSVSLEGLDALATLPLEELDLGGKSVYAPLDAILTISTLQVLDLSGAFSEGTDYSRFSNLTALRELDLSGYRDMEDVPPGPGQQYWSYQARPAAVFVDALGALTALERLDLSGCGVEDIESLRTLAALTYLDLSDTLVTDLAPLEGLTALGCLDVTGCRIGDLSPVEGREGLVVIR